MSKKLTISNRWRNWAIAEPMWAYSALGLMMLSFVSLGVHLGLLQGFWRGLSLIVMIISAVLCDVILAIRKQWWWFSYWTICVLLGVGIWEIASYFFG